MMADTVRMHPWFRLPTLKRKSTYIYHEDDSHLAQPNTNSPPNELAVQQQEGLLLPPPKRRRCDVLERGLAQLSIAPPDAFETPSTGASIASGGWDTVPAYISPVSLERHPIVTEPEETPIECDQEESWFEPEKDRTSLSCSLRAHIKLIVLLCRYHHNQTR